MARDRWHILRDGTRYTVSRHLPPRFDVVAQAAFPAVDPGRLARQVRQDMWRMLKDLRGFSPVVQIDTQSGGMTLLAGGRVAPDLATSRISRKIEALLNDPGHRRRWITWAHAGKPGS